MSYAICEQAIKHFSMSFSTSIVKAGIHPFLLHVILVGRPFILLKITVIGIL